MSVGEVIVPNDLSNFSQKDLRRKPHLFRFLSQGVDQILRERRVSDAQSGFSRTETSPSSESVN